MLHLPPSFFVGRTAAFMLLCVFAAACASETSEPSDGDPTTPAPPNSPQDPTSPGDPTSPPPPTTQVLPTLAASRVVVDDAFATAPLCADCHANVQGSDAMRTKSRGRSAPTTCGGRA